VRIRIREGDQFRVGSISMRGNSILSENELRKEVKLTPGDIFSRDTLREDVNRIIDKYDSIARPFAGVVPQFNIDPDRKTVAITIDIQEGGEVRIGRIDITGNTKTRDKVIRREMRLDEGDLYNKKAIRRSYERLYNLNYFETVDIVPERRLQEALLDLNVKVKEKLTGTLSIGGGYSSVDGLIGIAEVTQGNFLGRGQVVKFKTQWGGTRRTLVLSFTEPYLFDKPLRGTVDLYNQTQEYDGYSLKTGGFGLSLGKSYGEFVSSSIRYSFDSSETIDYDLTRIPSTLLKQIADYGTELTTSAVTGSITRDTRDYYLDPKEGSRNSLVVEYAGGPFGGDADFFKVVADSGWYFPLFWDTVFMARGRAGYAGSYSDKPLPIGERFYVGGLSTVRGFKYGAAGPMEPVKDLTPPWPIVEYNRIGGNKELIFNTEFIFPLVPAARLKGLVFYDAGAAFYEYDTLGTNPDGSPRHVAEHIRLGDLRHSWGFGFRWLTPVGPLRFEWGYVINKKPEDQLSEFEFSIGTMF
jgi:outer membrane protein insertion porin family